MQAGLVGEPKAVLRVAAPLSAVLSDNTVGLVKVGDCVGHMLTQAACFAASCTDGCGTAAVCAVYTPA